MQTSASTMRGPLQFLVASALLLAAAASTGSQKIAAPLWGCLPPAGWQHVLRQVEAASADQPHTSASSHSDYLGYMLANFSSAAASGSAALDSEFARTSLDGVSHYRLVPGIFMDGIDYHFDGLATVFKFSFNATHVNWISRPYDSNAYKSFDKCIFFWQRQRSDERPRALLQQPRRESSAYRGPVVAHDRHVLVGPRRPRPT